MIRDDDLDELDFDPAANDDDDGDEMVSSELDSDHPESLTGVEESPEFYVNLAGIIDESEVDAISVRLYELTDQDKIAHAKRVARYAEASARTGLDGAPKAGADFEGASHVASPMIVEAAIDFASSAIRELMPVGGAEGGPVKQKTLAKPTQKRVDRAKRKSTHMNWQLTTEMPSFRDSMEEMLTQLAMSGRQYMKLYYDPAKRRLTEMFVNFDEVWLPAASTSFASAKRHTHAQPVDRITFGDRVAAGIYRDLDLTDDPSAPEVNEAQAAGDKVAGKERDSTNLDGTRLVREVFAYIAVPGDELTGGEIAPYIVSIDDESRQVLAIYRNWDEDDPTRDQIGALVEFPFIWWRGAPIGLPDIIGGLSVAQAGALNALLDSAHLNNLQAAVRLKGKNGDNSKNIEIAPGQIAEINAPVGVDDIRKTIMPLPLNQPSAVLFSLLGFLSEAGRGVVNVALEKLAEAKADMPVGTTLALIEQGAKVYAAIHSRLHRSFERLLKVQHQLNRMYLDEEALKREAGEVLAFRADYEGAMDVVPVSDPNIFSETQRFAQVQAVAARATGNPLYDQRKVETLILKQLKIPEAEDLLIAEPEAKRLNPVNENVAAAQGAPLIAYPDQDHIAHLRTHIEFLLSPLFGMNPILQPLVLPVMIPHLKDHMVYAYAAAVEASSTALVGRPIVDLMDDDDEVSKQMDDFLSEGSTIFLDSATEIFEAVMPAPEPPPVPGEPPPANAFLAMLTQMNQLLQQFQPPPPQDPAAIAAQDVQRKGAADAQNAQIEQVKLQVEGQKVEAKKQEVAAKQAAVETDRLQEDRLQQRALGVQVQTNAVDNEVKERINTADNLTALTIAEGEIAVDGASALSTGGGIDPGP